MEPVETEVIKRPVGTVFRKFYGKKRGKKEM